MADDFGKDMLEMFTLRVNQGVAQILDTVRVEADRQRREQEERHSQSEGRIVSQVMQLREEQRREFDEVKTDVKKLADGQAKQGEDIARIDTRLNEGDKKFNAQEARLTLLEQEQQKQGKGIAGMIGAATAGGGLGAYISHLLSK